MVAADRAVFHTTAAGLQSACLPESAALRARLGKHAALDLHASLFRGKDAWR